MYAINRMKVQRVLSHGLSAILTVSGPNFFYLTGKNLKSFERPLFMIATIDECLVVAPKLEEERISDLKCNEIIYSDGDNPFKHLYPEVRAMGLKSGDKIGLDPEMKIDLYLKLREVLYDFNLVSGSEALLLERMKKDENELEKIEAAANILDGLFKEAENFISEGTTEAEIMTKLAEHSRKLGADADQILSIQSGANTAIPHHEYSQRALKRGDLVLLDLVVAYKGYHADLTRMYSLGMPSEEIMEKFEAVRDAVEVGISESKAGILGGSLDSIVRGVLEKKGLSKFFTHRTGHGLGIEVHEMPNIAPGSKDAVELGSVFTIEPGVYFPERFGIRLEVDAVVKEDKILTLGKYPLEIKVL